MGQAKRRKLAGDYPEQKPKPRTKARIKRYVSPSEELTPMLLSMMGMFTSRRKRSEEFMRIQREMNSL